VRQKETETQMMQARKTSQIKFYYRVTSGLIAFLAVLLAVVYFG
jgi:hypothetical protein